MQENERTEMSEEIVEFLIPLRHEDLEDEQMGKYYVMTVLEVASANQSILQGCLTDVEESLEEKAYLIHKHENFDTLYSMLKYVESTVSGLCRILLLLLVCVVEMTNKSVFLSKQTFFIAVR